MKFLTLATAVAATKIKTLSTEALKAPEDESLIPDIFKDTGAVTGSCATSIHPYAKSLAEIFETSD